MTYEIKITSWSKKKIVYKFHGDPTFRWKVISEKQCYAALKYIVDNLILEYPLHITEGQSLSQKKMEFTSASAWSTL